MSAPKVMILAAGRGERLKPLTYTVPKALVPVKNKPLIVYHLEKLALAHCTDIVINIFYLGHKIKQYLGKGTAFGVNIEYSEETALLETGGGIIKALPLLGREDFMLINGDVYTDFDIKPLISVPVSDKNKQAHLILVPNPLHHPQGDYGINAQGGVDNAQRDMPKYTYAGIAKLSPSLFKNRAIQPIKLAEIFVKAIEQQAISAELYSGFWYDVGSVERLRELESKI